MGICGYCNHPGYHAQFIPPGAEPSRRCGDCQRCRQAVGGHEKMPTGGHVSAH